MKNKLYCIIIFLLGLFISGCAGTGGGLGSISKTNQLAPGMSPNEVKNILGEASQTEFIGDKWVWKYSLHQIGKGFIPFYLVFGKENPGNINDAPAIAAEIKIKRLRVNLVIFLTK